MNWSCRNAFWVAEPGGFGGRLLPLSLLPHWIIRAGAVLPFASLYAFPMRILLGQPTTAELARGFLTQGLWLSALSGLVHWTWRRGLLAYEAYGG